MLAVVRQEFNIALNELLAVSTSLGILQTVAILANILPFHLAERFTSQRVVTISAREASGVVVAIPVLD